MSTVRSIDDIQKERQAEVQMELERREKDDQKTFASVKAPDPNEKDEQLSEKSNRIQELKDLNIQLQFPSSCATFIETHTEQLQALLEKIMTEYELSRKDKEKRKEPNEIFERNIANISRFVVNLLNCQLETEKEQAVKESEQLRGEISRLRQKTGVECCICLEKKPCVVFMPCRHMVICDSCHALSTFTQCPLCRAQVCDSIKVFS
ncbi:hypothetical protein COOONC_07619 [Cooperia oncophora]